MHEMDRRTFLAAAGAMALSPIARAAAGEYPFATLPEAWAAAGFDPAADGAASILVAADCHYGLSQPPRLMPAIELANRMQPRPAAFIVDGDVVNTVSTHFGHVPTAAERAKAIDELKLFRDEIGRLDPAIALRLTMGNHDTYPGEEEPELFREVFPGLPAYQAMDAGGVRLVMLNGHHGGRIDDKQRQWLEAEAAKTGPDRQVMLFVHQPALGSRVFERLISPAVREAYRRHHGPMWLIGGHVHHNRESAFALDRTSIVQASITCSGTGIWGDHERPGFWLYGLQDGQVKARVFHRIGHGFRTQPAPDRSAPQKLPQPWDGVEKILWRTMVGEGDGPYRVEQRAGDAETAWCYVKSVTYRLPIGKVSQARRVGVLASLSKKGIDAVTLSISADGRQWRTLERSSTTGSAHVYEIGEGLGAADDLLVRFDDASGQSNVGGFALLG